MAASRPGTVRCEVKVDLPRPRDAAILTDPEFMEIKRKLLAVVEEESMKSFATAVAT
jgi:ABC-type nitrate/sulfonate/bicarbonate transport system ATPase subunit